MDTASLILGFLGGSAVGAVATALITVSHQRRERLRDRMLQAAEAFLTAVERAQEALWQFIAAATELLESKNAAIAHAEMAKKQALDHHAAWVASGQPDEDVPEPFQRAIRIFDVFEAADGVANPLDLERRDEAERATESARKAIQDLLVYEGETALAPLAGVLRESIRKQSRFMTALKTLGDRAEGARESLQRVHSTVPRIVLLYPGNDEDHSEAAQEANTTKEALLDLFQQISGAMSRESSAWADEEVTAAMQRANDAVVAFSAAASKRARSRWRL